MRVHIGKVPHLCTICFTDFSKSAEMLSDKTGVDSMSYVCKVCEDKIKAKENKQKDENDGDKDSEILQNGQDGENAID